MGKNSKNINTKGRSKWSNEQYARLTYGMLQHPNFMALGGAAVKVLMFMLTKHNGYNNGKIALSYDDMAKPLHIGKGTAYRACEDLEYYGFIKLRKMGHFYGRKACEWEITFIQSEGYEPSHDWKIAKKRLRPRPAKTKEALPTDDVLLSPEYLESRKHKIEARCLTET